MSTITITGPARRDGRYPVRLAFEGAPNAFGGHYPTRFLNKLYALDVLRAWIARPGVELIGGAQYLPPKEAA